MMMRHPFFGALLHNCKTQVTKEIPTAAIDKRYNIYFNERFMTEVMKSEDEQLFVYGHEIMHGALLHVFRIFEWCDPEARKWGNIAADYLVNFTLVEM